jgi:hypothetical protein
MVAVPPPAIRKAAPDGRVVSRLREPYMSTNPFASREDFMSHVITPFPMSRARSEKFYAEFQQFGYVAMQGDMGLTASARLGGGNFTAAALGESSNEAQGRIPIVLLSNPVVGDEEFFRWADIVRAWVEALTPDATGAYMRKISVMKKIDRGIPLSALHKDMPDNLLFSYRRLGSFVIIVDSGAGGKRTIYTTKGIG